MTVAELRTFLNRNLDMLDDAAVLVVSSSDHSYSAASPSVEWAERNKRGNLSEYFDDANMSPGSKRVKVLHFG